MVGHLSLRQIEIQKHQCFSCMKKSEYSQFTAALLGVSQ